MTEATEVQSSELPSDGQRAVFAWYCGILEQGRLPSRADFEPLDFPEALANLVLVDVEQAPRRYRTRLVGTAVTDATGQDGTGNYFDEVEGTKRAIERADHAVSSYRPGFESGVPMTWSPKDYKLYSILSLPLSSDGETVDMLMYCLYFE